MLAPIACGFIGTAYGYHYAFLLTALVMFSGIIIFIFGKHHLPQAELKSINPKPRSLVAIYIGLLIAIPLLITLINHHLDGYLLIVASIATLAYLAISMRQREPSTRDNIKTILMIQIVVIIFSIFLGQGGTTLNLFIERLVNRHFFTYLIPTPEFYALDPIFMLTIGPLFIAMIIKLCKKKQPTLLIQKLSGSLLLLALGFIVFLLAAHQAAYTGQASALYVVAAYLLFPLAELLLFPAVLSSITHLAPKNLSGLIMGIFMLSQAIGGYLMGIVSIFGKITFPIHNAHDLQLASKHYFYFFAFIIVSLLCSSLLVITQKNRIRN